VSTSRLKIASCLAQEEQESLTSPLTMGKCSFSKKSKDRTWVWHVGALSAPAFPFSLAFLANSEGYLKRGRLAHSWFSNQGAE
jgi:hypothetical protein